MPVNAFVDIKNLKMALSNCLKEKSIQALNTVERKKISQFLKISSFIRPLADLRK